MKKTYTINCVATLILGALLASGVAIIAAPQTGNDRLNEDQMYQQAFVADDGTIQVKVTGRAIPTPQTGNDRLSTVQMLQQAFVAADGTFQAVLDEASSGIPFVNYSGLADNDLLQYDTTDTAWENITQASLLHNNFGGLTTGDPHTQYQKETDFTAGSVLFRGATAITEDNDGLYFRQSPIRLGIGTNDPAYIVSASVTSDSIEAFRLDQLGTGGAFLSLHTQAGGLDPVVGFGIDGVGAGPSWHIGLDNSAPHDVLTFYQGAFRSGFKRMVFSHYRSIILGSDVGLPALGTSTYAVIPNVAETTSESKLSILSGNAGKSAINLGDTDDEDAAYISYDHATTTMKLHTEGAYVQADYGISAIQSSTNYTGDFRNINANGSGIYVRTFSALSGNSILVLQGGNGSKKIFYARCDGNIGIGTEGPDRRFEILDTAAPQQRWTHTDNSVYGEVQATSNGYLEFNATGNRILLGKDDGDKWFLGAGYDFSAQYDGTAAILKTDEVAASDLQLTTGAAKTLVLNTPVYDDLNFDPDRSGGPVATQPDSVTINNVFHREFTSANNQLCGAVQELPHGYKLSSTLYPHIHIFLKASETVGTTGVTFTLYWELRQSTGTTSGSVPLAATSAQLGTTAGGNSLTLYDATGFAGSAELGGQLALTIARTAGDAGDVVVTTYGVHYAVDTIGSRLLDTK